MQPIQWFPGHMAKAKREILEKIKLVDLVIELKDARIPYSSTNPMIDEIIGNKPRLVLLCKANIADPKITKEWIEYYKKNNIIALDIDCLTGYNMNKIKQYCRLVLKDLFEARKKKGITSEAMRTMILGIPNVGKSTLINTLAKRKAVATGDKPGVTKTQTWIKITDDFMIMDTPGILWPKFEDQIVGLKLAMCGSIKDEILDFEHLTIESINYLKDNYSEALKARYNLTELKADPYQILEDIGRKRGCMLKGGIVDLEKASTILMTELRQMKIGAMSFETTEVMNKVGEVNE